MLFLKDNHIFYWKYLVFFHRQVFDKHFHWLYKIILKNNHILIYKTWFFWEILVKTDFGYLLQLISLVYHFMDIKINTYHNYNLQHIIKRIFLSVSFIIIFVTNRMFVKNLFNFKNYTIQIVHNSYYFD